MWPIPAAAKRRRGRVNKIIFATKSAFVIISKMKKGSLLIVSGVTSHVFPKLYNALFAHFELFACSRSAPEMMPPHVTYLTGTEARNRMNSFDAALWLGSGEDAQSIDLWKNACKSIRTCVCVGSGALGDYFLGKVAEAQLSNYAKGKLALYYASDAGSGAKTAAAYLVPGFYINDLPEAYPPRGPGLETATETVLYDANSTADIYSDRSKDKSVTPVSVLLTTILRFLINEPTVANYDKDEPIFVCSDDELSRAFIRSVIFPEDNRGFVIGNIEPINRGKYASVTQKIQITLDEIKTAIRWRV